MLFDGEKDYIIRIIKEMVRMLFSLMLGKKYVSVEPEKEDKYQVSGYNKNFRTENMMQKMPSKPK